MAAIAEQRDRDEGIYQLALRRVISILNAKDAENTESQIGITELIEQGLLDPSFAPARLETTDRNNIPAITRLICEEAIRVKCENGQDAQNVRVIAAAAIESEAMDLVKSGAKPFFAVLEKEVARIQQELTDPVAAKLFDLRPVFELEEQLSYLDIFDVLTQYFPAVSDSEHALITEAVHEMWNNSNVNGVPGLVGVVRHLRSLGVNSTDELMRFMGDPPQLSLEIDEYLESVHADYIAVLQSLGIPYDSGTTYFRAIREAFKQKNTSRTEPTILAESASFVSMADIMQQVEQTLGYQLHVPVVTQEHVNTYYCHLYSAHDNSIVGFIQCPEKGSRADDAYSLAVAAHERVHYRQAEMLLKAAADGKYIAELASIGPFDEAFAMAIEATYYRQLTGSKIAGHFTDPVDAITMVRRAALVKWQIRMMDMLFEVPDGELQDAQLQDLNERLGQEYARIMTENTGLTYRPERYISDSAGIVTPHMPYKYVRDRNIQHMLMQAMEQRYGRNWVGDAEAMEAFDAAMYASSSGNSDALVEAISQTADRQGR